MEGSTPALWLNMVHEFSGQGHNLNLPEHGLWMHKLQAARGAHCPLPAGNPEASRWDSGDTSMDQHIGPEAKDLDVSAQKSSAFRTLTAFCGLVC